MADPKVEIIKRPIEQVSGNIKKAAWSAVIESVVLIILGILFVVLPDTMVKIFSYVIGAVLIAKGAYNILSYLTDKGQKEFYDTALLTGIMFALIGVAVLMIGENIASVFRVIVGIIVIYESLMRINVATKLSAAGVESWKYVLVLAILMLVLGVFITFNTGAVVTLVGWLMIVTGIIGIVGDVMFIRNVNIVVDKLTGAIKTKK